jgi:aminoglycoside phosphotransferase (APT) family kinase protein
MLALSRGGGRALHGANVGQVEKMNDRQLKFSGTVAVRAGQELDLDRLHRWLVENLADFGKINSVAQFKGGQSNPTYKLKTAERDFVLRRMPSGTLLKGAHAVDREYRVIKALGLAGFPVARALAYCESAHIVGTPFYVMEMVEGRIFWDSTFSQVSARERHLYFSEMNDVIARLHNLDPNALGLGDFGKPGNYFERQISRFSSQYRSDLAAGAIGDLDQVIDWLGTHIPASEEASVVHGDLRADNMIWAPDEPKVLAVLDWELSTIGHPLADFSYNVLMYHLPPHILGGFAGENLTRLGIPQRSEYIQDYCRRTKRENAPLLGFCLVFNLFRLAAILHGIKGRMIRGSAVSPDSQSLVEHLPELCLLARKMIEQQ